MDVCERPGPEVSSAFSDATTNRRPGEVHDRDQAGRRRAQAVNERRPEAALKAVVDDLLDEDGDYGSPP